MIDFGHITGDTDTLQRYTTMRSERQWMQEILRQTIVSLCKSGLKFSHEMCVEGLLGVTLDKSDVFLVNIKEVVSLNNSEATSSVTPQDSVHDLSAGSQSTYTTTKKRKHSHCDSSEAKQFVPVSTSCTAVKPAKQVLSPAVGTESLNLLVAQSMSGIVAGGSTQLDLKEQYIDGEQVYSAGYSEPQQSPVDDGSDSDNCIVIKEEAVYVETEYSSALESSEVELHAPGMVKYQTPLLNTSSPAAEKSYKKSHRRHTASSAGTWSVPAVNKQDMNEVRGVFFSLQ